MSGLPLYGQIAEDLESQLGPVYAPGAALPKVSELAEAYAVNRLTVTEALALLSRRGLVQTIKGKGTFAALPTNRFLLNGNGEASLTAAMAKEGRTVQNVVLGVALIDDDVLREQLGAHNDVQRFDSVRYVDDAPWSITRTWIDPERFPGLESAWREGSLFEVLQNQYGVTMRRSTRTFAAGTADPTESELLQVPVASPILQESGPNVNDSGEVLTVVVHRFRGDRVEIVVNPG